MKRLTVDTTLTFCDIAQCSGTQGGANCEDGYCDQRRVYERLREYEQLERDGRLVVLPCNVGDDVFTMRWSIKNEKYEVFVGKVKNVRYDAIDGSVMVSDGEYCREWGKDAFSSRQEAEAALGGDPHG